MKALAFGLIVGFLISCTDSERYYLMSNIDGTNKVIINADSDSCWCLARNLEQHEIDLIKKEFDRDLKVIDHKILSSSFHLILFQDSLRIGDILVDKINGNILKYIDTDTEITIQTDSDINQLLIDMTNINNLDCSKNILSITFDSISVGEFINILKIENPIPNGVYRLNTFGNAPANWISKNDIAQMIELVDSQERTYCIMQMISSNMPDLLEYSTLGGQIMNLIDSYRFNRRYPYFLTNCAINDEMRKKEILEWWKKQ